jgi:CRISPR type III-B/RAMP module RAMP protein Cmr6
MEKKDKPKSFSSFDALKTMNDPKKTQEVKSNSNQEVAQNFYSFLHKRKRFYESDVFIEKKGKNEIEYAKFDIKKIHILDAKQDEKNPKRIKEFLLLDKFNYWEKSSFYQTLLSRHHQNALQLTGGNLLPKVYNNKEKNELQFQPDWRLAIGLGTGSVFETSISLHHIYGFPYIPASAVKGVLRSYLITTLQGVENNSEALLFHRSKEMCDIFGCPAEIDREKTHYREEREGCIIFFDAYPTRSPQGCIKADIMNNHYDKWYNEGKPPADYYNPNPIIFLTVQELSFQFMIGLQKGKDNPNIKFADKSGDMLTVVSLLLKDALQEKGIGAKTAVGYGYMK